MTRILSLILIFILMKLLQYFNLGIFENIAMEATVALGFVILVAYNVGVVFRRIGLPKLTGYMVTGVIFGPYVIGFLSKEVVMQLKLIDNIALSLIAFSAGRELKLRMLKERAKSIFSITFFAMTMDFLAVSLFVFFASSLALRLGLFPFLKDMSIQTRMVVALLFGCLSLAKSPVTTIAVIEESNARGHFTETVLGVIILKDILLLIFFAIVLSLAKRIVFSQEAFNLVYFAKISWKLLGSLVVGSAVGVLLSLYIRFIKQELVFFVISAAFLATLIANQLKLDPLLLSMSAGFFIENFSKEGDAFLSAIKKGSTLVYIIFFAMAGAGLNLDTLKDVWFIAVILLIVRGSSTWFGISTGSRMVENFAPMRRYGWTGFINQAGVTLAIATIIENTFPQFGPSIKAIALAMIAITDYIGPPLFRWALIKSGEAH